MIALGTINSGMVFPRRTEVLLADESRVGATVLGRVREVEVYVESLDQYCRHRTVRVHVDGEPEPRRVEYTRLLEWRDARWSTDEST